MKKKYIDMNAYKRINHFNYFTSIANPHVGMTVDVDITDLRNFCKENNYSFYLTFMHVVALAANRVKEFRQRIFDGKIVEYDECGTSHTEDVGDGTYCYCTLYHNMSFDEYIGYAKKKQVECKELKSIEEDDDVEGLYFISTVPWIKYTSLVQPTDGNNDTNPRITWGKYEKNQNGRYMMPVTTLLHHALVDGKNIADFYHYLNEEMKKLVNK